MSNGIHRNTIITSAATGRTYWIDEDGHASIMDDEDPGEYIPDEDGSEAYARMLERRAEAGSWWGHASIMEDEGR